ncbi:MAG: hypothetical protein FWH22_03700 [Fibromonadales bacterium]|nr:hypothetical protein [Fibromonadales bacterium]
MQVKNNSQLSTLNSQLVSISAFLLLHRVWNALFAAGVCVYSFFAVKNIFALNNSDVALLSLGVFFFGGFCQCAQ